MLGQAKPLASLSSGLLARKGAARPAMRPQGFASLATIAEPLDDLGWNDMGGGAPPEPPEPAPPTPIDAAVAMSAAPPEKPPVLVVRAALADAVEAAEAPPVVNTVSVATATRFARETAHKGRAAFTLRLDAGRHLRLRLASALTNQSSQQLVQHALDRLLAEMPAVDALAAQLPPQHLKASKGKRR